MFFESVTTLGQAFQDDICAAIESYLAATDAKQVTAAGQMELALPGLLLRGARVLMHRVQDGVQLATVRFTKAIGNLQAALRPKFRAQETLREEREDLATRTLVDLVHPCLDLFDHLTGVPVTEAEVGRLHSRFARLTQTRDELFFFSGLIRRLISTDRDPAPVAEMQADLAHAMSAVTQRHLSSSAQGTGPAARDI